MVHKKYEATVENNSLWRIKQFHIFMEAVNEEHFVSYLQNFQINSLKQIVEIKSIEEVVDDFINKIKNNHQVDESFSILKFRIIHRQKNKEAFAVFISVKKAHAKRVLTEMREWKVLRLFKVVVPKKKIVPRKSILITGLLSIVTSILNFFTAIFNFILSLFKF